MEDTPIVEQSAIEPKTFDPKYALASKQHQPILLLSNTKDLSRILQISLETLANWRVFPAALDYENLILIETVKPKLILLDTTLPNVRELGMLKAILAHPALQNVPIILLTERMRLADRKLYARLGVCNAVVKPFDIIDLVQQIAIQLNQDCLNFDEVKGDRNNLIHQK
ncbi:MAG: response regulator [Pleurocapsa sp.]